MPYTHISHVPGHSLGDYQAVADVLGPEPPAGRLALIVGEADGALHIVDVWDSKAHADLFAAERLMDPHSRERRLGIRSITCDHRAHGPGAPNHPARIARRSAAQVIGA